MKSGKDYLYIEKEGSDELIVSFNYHNGGNKFFKYGTLTKDIKHNLLFITNDNNWYLDENGEKYKNFLAPYVSKYKPENVLFFGSSMGAYGALIHGVYFGVNIFSSNPQIDEKIVFKYEIPEKNNFANSLLKKNIKLLDVKDIYDNLRDNPIIHLLYGNSPCDRGNMEKFLSYIPPKVKLILEKLPFNTHDYWTHSNEDILYRFKIMKEMRKITYSKYK